MKRTKDHRRLGFLDKSVLVHIQHPILHMNCTHAFKCFASFSVSDVLSSEKVRKYTILMTWQSCLLLHEEIIQCWVHELQAIPGNQAFPHSLLCSLVMLYASASFYQITFPALPSDSGTLLHISYPFIPVNYFICILLAEYLSTHS